MGEEHDAAATNQPETTMYPYMESPHPPYPPEYDKPETTKSEVLDVVFGRKVRDGLGRDFDNLMSDTAMMLYAEHLADHGDAERDLMAFIGRNWRDAPANVRAIFDDLAESAAKQAPVWRHP